MNFGIIAAGEGSRLAEEGLGVPKPLVRICGVPMIERLVRIFEENGAREVCIIVNEQMVEVQQFIEKLRERVGVRIELVVKSTPSSMHSFYELGGRLKGKGRFIVTTVDTIFRQEDFSRYVAAYEGLPEEYGGMMAVTRFVDDEKPLYVEVGRDGNIVEFSDTSRQGSLGDFEEYVSGGIYGLGDRAIEVLDSCLAQGVSRMRNYQRALVAGGLMLGAYDMGKILDVDHIGDIAKAEDYLTGNGV